MHQAGPPHAVHGTHPTSTPSSFRTALAAAEPATAEPGPGSASPTTATAPSAPAAAAALAGGAWQDLVTAALLGTERRRPPVPTRETDPALALLDAAAVRTVRRRAGVRPAPAPPPPERVPADPRPPLPPAAARRLELLLAEHRQPGEDRWRGTTPDLTELLPQWLRTANLRGFSAPPHLVPALLDVARARTDLRADVLAFAGPRGLWLARLNPDWRFALRSAPDGVTALPAAGGTEEVRRLWEEGLFAERAALLTALRAKDPAAARDLLTGTWSSERAEDRSKFLDAFHTGLCPDDEPLLEKALTDRSRHVRAVAAALLSALPGSALSRRMADRAASCVRLDRTGEEPTLVVTAPQHCDSEMKRDGVVPKPPGGWGERAWWLHQLLEAAPLAEWSARLGDRSPAEIVALPVSDEWRGQVHTAWCRAAVRQRDIAWSRALLGALSAQDSDGPETVSLAERAKLLPVLPAAERAEWVAGFVAAHGLSEAFPLLSCCAAPWTQALGRAVVDALAVARDTGSYPWSFSGVMGLAERCLDPAETARPDPLAAIPEERQDTAPDAEDYWSEAFQRLANTLRLRATMQAELTHPQPAASTADP